MRARAAASGTCGRLFRSGVSISPGTRAQARMPAVHAAVIFALEPVFTALFAAMTLGERLSSREAWGGGLVLVGIVVSELRLRR